MKKTVLVVIAFMLILSMFTSCNSGNEGDRTDAFIGEAENAQSYETAADKITGDYFILNFSAMKSDDGKTNNKDTLYTLRKRFDALATPYSISVLEEDSKYITYQVVVDSAHIGIPTLVCLTASQRMRIQSQYKEFSTYDDEIASTEIVSKNGGEYALVCELTNYAKSKLTEYAVNNSNAPLYLTCNSIAISSLTLKPDMNFDFLEFENLIFTGEEGVSKENKYMLDLLEAVQETVFDYRNPDKIRPHPLRIRLIERNGIQTKDILGEHKKIDFPISYWTTADEAVKNKVQDIFPEADVFKDFFAFSSLGGAIVIDLPMMPSEHMVDDFMDNLVSIYGACDMDRGAYGKIIFMNSKSDTQLFQVDFYKVSDTAKSEVKRLDCQVVFGSVEYKEQASQYVSGSDMFRDRKISVL